MRTLLPVLLLVACVPDVPMPELAPSNLPKLTAGVPLDLSLPRHPSGERWSLAASKGKVVLVDVWATWCEPCRDSLPLYGDLLKEFEPRGFEVMTVNVDADPRVVTPFLEEAKVSLPVVRDPEALAMTSKLQVKLMPTAFLFDRKGNLRFRHEGFDEAELSTWLAEIEGLLAEP